MPKISIIIPCYKVEQYISKCLDSIQSQIFQDWEAICIDDGSPDNTGKILDEYANKDSRIKVIHQENGGVSNARNKGIDIAIGQYIGFVDPDDWIEYNYYQTLVNAAEKNKADVVQCGYTLFKDQGFKKVVWKKNIATSFAEVIKELKRGFIWNKLWKAELIKKNNLRFDTSISYCEDLLFSVLASEYVGRFVTVDYSGYYYRHTANSAANNPIHVQRNRNASYDICRKVLVFFESKDKKKLKLMKTFLVSKMFPSHILEDSREYAIAKEIIGLNFKLMKNRLSAIRKNIFKLSFKNKEITVLGKIYSWQKR